MLPFSERVRNVFGALQTSAHRFAIQHGLNRSSVFNTLNAERKPSFDLVERICAVEPRISAEYLLRGEGEPLRDGQLITTMTTTDQLRQFKIDFNELIDARLRQIEQAS